MEHRPPSSASPHRADNEDGREVASLVVDTTLYTSDALFRACYAFTDRCYLFLKQLGADEVLVEFRRSDSSHALADVVGAFANELIDQRVRADIARRRRAIRGGIAAHTFPEATFVPPA